MILSGAWAIPSKVSRLPLVWFVVVLTSSLTAHAQDASPCAECGCTGDRDGDGRVTVDEAVEVVGNVLEGCAQLRWHERCPFIAVRERDVCPPTTVFCTTEELDASCSEYNARCCVADSLCTNGHCNTSLECTDHDPSPVACRLRSRRHYKHDIEYLAQSDLDQLRSKLLHMPLTRFRYNSQPPATAPHLGFIIEDVEPSPCVDAQNDAVDLYGYVSMAVATLQIQDHQIQELQQQMNELRRQMRQAENDPGRDSDNPPSQQRVPPH